MKKEMVFVAVSILPLASLAQQRSRSNKTDTLQENNSIFAHSRILTFSQLDQRKIYHWANGQRSTPTGRLAGEDLPKYVRLFGDDSAMVVEGPAKK